MATGIVSYTPKNEAADLMLSNLNYYVSPSGNDTTGDGTQAKPFRQISKAISQIPIITNESLSVTINVSAGTYGDFEISGNVAIAIVGVLTPSVTFGRISVNNSATLDITGFSSVTIDVSSSAKTGILAYRNAVFYTNCPLVITGSAIGNGQSALASQQGGIIFVNTTVNISGFSSGVRAIQNGMTSVDGLATISNCTYGLIAQNGGIVSVNSYSLSSVTNSTLTSGGGKIELGKQEWQLIGSVTGANSVAIDSNKYTEFLVVHKRSDTGFTYIIPANVLTTSTQSFRNGGYNTNSSYWYTQIDATKTSITNNAYNNNGTNDLANSTMTVYGKR